MELDAIVVETIKHHHIIHFLIGHNVQLINIEMAKAVVALNPQLLQDMNYRKEKCYYKVYMHSIIETFWLSIRI